MLGVRKIMSTFYTLWNISKLPVSSLNTKNFVISEVKVKDSFPQNMPCRHGGVEVQLYLFSTSSLVRVDGQHHTAAVVLTGTSPGSCFTGVRVALGRSGQRRENLLPTWQFESCTIQQVARHYLDPIVTSLLQMEWLSPQKTHHSYSLKPENWFLMIPLQPCPPPQPYIKCFPWCKKRLGESSGKLPLRTCSGCSLPEPYWSPDWALVPPQTGPRAEY
jgi:hypothetical protein